MKSGYGRLRIAIEVAGGAYIEERSFGCVARRANTARKKKACDSAQDDGKAKCAAEKQAGRSGGEVSYK